MKVKFFFLFLLCSVWGFAAQNPWLNTELSKFCNKPECMIELQRSDFINSLNGMKNVIERGNKNNTPIKAIQFIGYKSTVESWVKYKYIEVDTGLSKRWLRKIIKILDAMYKYCDTMAIAQRKKNTKLYDAAKEKYKQYYKLLVKTLKNPERAKRRVRDALQIQKVKEYKAYQKYLEKQEEIEKADPR